MPTIASTENKKHENIQLAKIIDTDFDKKLEEFLCVERNVKAVKDLFANFFDQTNSK